MIPRSHNAISILLLLQFTTIIGGTLIVMGFLKANGYPDTDYMRWNPAAVFIRSWGWLAIFLPALWYLFAFRWLRKSGDDLFPVKFIVFTVIVTLLLMFFYVSTALSAGVIVI